MWFRDVWLSLLFWDLSHVGKAPRARCAYIINIELLLLCSVTLQGSDCDLSRAVRARKVYRGAQWAGKNRMYGHHMGSCLASSCQAGLVPPVVPKSYLWISRKEINSQSGIQSKLTLYNLSEGSVPWAPISAAVEMYIMQKYNHISVFN